MLSRLSGTISNSVGEFTTLQTLDMSGNSLTGTIPNGIGSLLTLTSLSLSNNQCSGTLPLVCCVFVGTGVISRKKQAKRCSHSSWSMSCAISLLDLFQTCAYWTSPATPLPARCHREFALFPWKVSTAATSPWASVPQHLNVMILTVGVRNAWNSEYFPTN